MIEALKRSALVRGLPAPVKRALAFCYRNVFLPPGERPVSAQQIESVVTRIYNLAFKRSPGPEERQLWVNEVQSGRANLAQMVEIIATAPEAQQVRDRSKLVPSVPNGRFVQYTYETLLGRGAMAQEILHWDRLLRTSVGRDEMAVALFGQKATEALTTEIAPQVNDPTIAWVMGTDRFIKIKDWLATAEALPDTPPEASPRIYPSLAIAPGEEILVSAIASLYRGGNYIEQFLDNITSQTIFARSELIIIDADSPEDEFATISRYMERFPNIVYYRAPTRVGIYEAWNLGVHLARGRYLTNTNLDDLRRRDSFERQAEILEKFDFVDVVYQDFYFSFEGEASFDRTAAVGVQSELPVISPYNLMQSNSPHNAPMWRRQLHGDVGLFDASYRSAGDYDFWLRCARAGKVFYKVNDPHVVYFVNPQGLSTQPNTRGIDEANRITRLNGSKLVSRWLTTHDEEYLGEVSRRTGSHVDFGPTEQADMHWRYRAAQQGLRQLSATSRGRGATTGTSS